MATKSISQLDTQATAIETDLFEVAIVDANSASGYASKKESAAAIADAIVGEYQYPLRITGTTAKTIAGAINELKNLVDLLPQFAIEVVNTLPVSDISETTIYLVPAQDPEQGNYYEEYIYVNNAWELVGTTAVDLSGYYTSAQVDTLLAAKANTSSLATVATSGAYSDLSGKPTIDTALDTTSTNAVENRAVAGAFTEIKERLLEIELMAGYGFEDVYGLYVDYENNTFTRLCGAYGKTAGADFDNAAPFMRRRCNLADDGTVNAYYGDAGYADDGSNGQVMVEQPKFYYKVVPYNLTKGDNNVGQYAKQVAYYVTGTPREGFKLHPQFIGTDGTELNAIYKSAYEASLWDDSASEYYDDLNESAITVDYTADKLCSVSGQKPLSGNTVVFNKENGEKLAQNRGSRWHLDTIQSVSGEQLLMIIELGRCNTQTVIENGVVSYASGTGNEASQTGSTTSLGNASGYATSTEHIASDGTVTQGTSNDYRSITYRGLENFWGNIWKHVQGINIWGDSHMNGGQVYVCSDAIFDESKNSGNYEAMGLFLPAADGWSKYFGYSKKGDYLFFPAKVGGTSSAPIGDYVYRTNNLNGYRVARVGGSWSVGSVAGGFHWYCTYGVGHRARAIGGRLVLL